MQGQDEYLVNSSSKADTMYTVKFLSGTCQHAPTCLPHCTAKECCYLCRHMISCTCYDYQHGHLCKHVHKVYSLRRQQEIEDEKEIDDVDLPDDDASVIEEDQSTAAVQLHDPSKTVQDSAGICYHYINIM